jgi:hypothetical protein
MPALKVATAMLAKKRWITFNTRRGSYSKFEVLQILVKFIYI